jgi:hypothetical protein
MSENKAAVFRCAKCCALAGHPHAPDCPERTSPTVELKLPAKAPKDGANEQEVPPCDD